MNERWETRVQTVANALPYPPTPDIAARLRPRRRQIAVRRIAQIAAILLLALLGLMAVPEIRAQVMALFHIGSVEVIVTTATPPARFTAGSNLPSSVLDFPGATTLADAQQHFGHPIPLPSALGAPDRVDLIDAQQPIVVLAWLDSGGAVDVSLHLLPSGTYTLKMTSSTPEQTEVNGLNALWLPNPHWYILLTAPGEAALRVVDSSALVWAAADGITYRLETNRSLDDALKIADSMPIGNG